MKYIGDMKASLEPCYRAISAAAMKNYYSMNMTPQNNYKTQKPKTANKNKGKVYGGRQNTKGQNIEQIDLSRYNETINNALVKINQYKKDYPILDSEFYAARLDLEMLLNMLKYQKFMGQNEGSLAVNNETRIRTLMEGDVFLKMAMYDLYRLKEECKDTHYYQRYVDQRDVRNVTNIIFELERQIHQNINAYYDEKYGYKAKYYKRVDPNDFVVIAVTDRLISGLHDVETIKKVIFDFVKSKVQYRYDPAWKTDGVQPPALTLLSGRGDCDDHAILMASMFMRAGIYDVKLCEASIKGKSNFDHMYASAGDKAWDNLVPDVTKYRHKCVDLYLLSARN
jgi:predicted transglutaminase-like cysteine proteinase